MRAPRFWQRRGPAALTLAPLGALFRALVGLRRALYRRGWLASETISRPVVIVGNIDVGGSGKTPLVIALVELCRRRGLRPGIVSRGYRGGAETWPQRVDADSDPAEVGDEPVLLAQRCGVPLLADRDRVRAARTLLAEHRCDLIIADDGLQHYRLRRDLELCVIDADRRLGNGWCLPAGPLREPPSRLRSVDAVLYKRAPQRPPPRPDDLSFSVDADRVIDLRDPDRQQALSAWRGRRAHAVAGIGRPQGFFELLRGHHIDVVEHPFPDHHRYAAGDARFGENLPILLTEKDAVKWRARNVAGATAEVWYVPLQTRLDVAAERCLLAHIERLCRRAGADV